LAFRGETLHRRFQCRRGNGVPCARNGESVAMVVARRHDAVYGEVRRRKGEWPRG
jgi:hypothetical protein